MPDITIDSISVEAAGDVLPKGDLFASRRRTEPVVVVLNVSGSAAEPVPLKIIAGRMRPRAADNNTICTTSVLPGEGEVRVPLKYGVPLAGNEPLISIVCGPLVRTCHLRLRRTADVLRLVLERVRQDWPQLQVSNEDKGYLEDGDGRYVEITVKVGREQQVRTIEQDVLYRLYSQEFIQKLIDSDLDGEELTDEEPEEVIRRVKSTELVEDTERVYPSFWVLARDARAKAGEGGGVHLARNPLPTFKLEGEQNLGIEYKLALWSRDVTLQDRLPTDVLERAERFLMSGSARMLSDDFGTRSTAVLKRMEQVGPWLREFFELTGALRRVL